MYGGVFFYCNFYLACHCYFLSNYHLIVIYSQVNHLLILGLDPGIATIGFGLVEVNPADHNALSQSDPSQKTLSQSGLSKKTLSKSARNTPQLVDYGVIKTPKERTIGERLQIIYQDMHSLLEYWQPDSVGLEKLFFYRMGNLIPVAQARGVILLVLTQHDLVPIEFSPPQIKQALTGHGNADKLAVQSAVVRELNLPKPPQPDDCADALAVALSCWFLGTGF